MENAGLERKYDAELAGAPGSVARVAVVLRPAAGEILAMVSKPSYDTSSFKIVMTTAILEEEGCPIQQTIFDPDFCIVGDRVFLDHKKYGHGDVAQIVNDGVVYRPRVVREIPDTVTGRTLWSAEPEVINASPVSQATFEVVRQAMRGVVEGGTPSLVLTTPALLGGKTGTAETGVDEAKHSWFIGFSDVLLDGQRR